MKKTVTTILSLVLALILVSGLGSGVSNAHGKTRYNTVRVHHVAIVDCLAATDGMMVSAFNISPDLPDGVGIMGDETCAETLAVLLNGGFRMEGSTGITEFTGPRSRYTLVKTTKMRVPVDNNHGDDDDDDDDD